MKLLSRSLLVASVAAAGLLVGATSGSAYSGCPFSKLGTPTVTATGDSPGGLFSASPDSNALRAALGGLGAIAVLGGAVVVGQRRLAQATANEAALATEADLSVTTEVVLWPETAERAIDTIESDLVAGLRR